MCPKADKEGTLIKVNNSAKVKYSVSLFDSVSIT